MRLLPNKRILLFSLLLACRRETPPSETPRSTTKVGPGSVLIIEKRVSIARYLESEQILFGEVLSFGCNGVA